MPRTASPFTQATFNFLKDLRDNNNREWFKANKERYEEDVKEPMLRFIAAIQKPMKGISRHINVDPSPTGGSMFRIYRDTRFSPDKTPYKTHAAAQFRYKLAKDAHAPGFYIHIGIDNNIVGGGIWHPDNAGLGLIRARIASKPAEWEKVITNRRFREICGDVGGDKLTGLPRGYSPDERYIEYIKHKDFLAGVGFPRMLVMKRGFQEDVLGVYRAMTPLMKVLCAAFGFPW